MPTGRRADFSADADAYPSRAIRRFRSPATVLR